MLRKGFTLIELSIVLVIIGLIIGGILAAKSLTESARRISVMKEIGSLEYDLHRFKSTFRFFPGDLNNHQALINGYGWGNGSQTGNNDGLVDTTEAVGVFVEMNGGIGTKYPTCDGLGTYNQFAAGCGDPAYNGLWFVPDYNVPGSKVIKTAGMMFVASGSDNFINFGYVHPVGHVSPTILDGAVFSPEDVLAYDKKFDDGVGNTGRFQFMQGYGLAGNLCHAWAFDLSHTGKACYINWQILSDIPEPAV